TRRARAASPGSGCPPAPGPNGHPRRRRRVPPRPAPAAIVRSACLPPCGRLHGSRGPGQFPAMRELRAVLPYLTPYRREYAAGLGLVVVSNFFTTLGPRFLQRGVDALATA